MKIKWRVSELERRGWSWAVRREVDGWAKQLF